MPHHVASYSSNSSCSVGLLFQFILSQFLLAAPPIRKLEELLEGLQDMHLQEGEGYLLNEISEIIMRDLLGLKSNGKDLSIWDFGKGPLSQLRNLCYELHYALGISRAKFRPLLTHAKKSWSYCLQTHDHICLYQLASIKTDQESAAMRTSCIVSLQRSLKHLKGFQKQLFSLFRHFVEDENVLFFLWRNRQQFDAYYGENFSDQLIAKLFPKGGHERLQQMLVSRYTHREFHQLASCI